ncbi:MAG TPA: DUF503 domain-containing protein [Acidimicrobiales bacterium]|nr:DUF503 domain-containing protein [Acidimicrobiales bacterium]
MHAAALEIELYIRECRSLKAKRSVLRPIVDGLWRRYRVSASEVAHQNSWQQAALGVAAVAPSHAHLIDVLNECERFVWSFPEVEVLRVDRRWIEEEDRDPST